MCFAMNSLHIVVKKTGAELRVLRRRRVVLRTTLDLACADLGPIFESYIPAFATVILDAGHAESQFVPVDRLSWRDRFRLRQRASRTLPSSGTVVLPPVFRKIGVSGKTALIVTACELSPLSRNLLEVLAEAQIPLKAVDLLQRCVLEAVLKKGGIKTRWGCVLSEDETGGTMLTVWGHEHLVMVRSLPVTANLSEEVIQTFQYLGREAYAPEEGVTLFCQETLPQIDPRLLSEALGGPVVLGQSFIAPERLEATYLPQPMADALHRNYVLPRGILCGAQAVAAVAALALPFNVAMLYQESARTTAFLKQYSQPSVCALQAAFQYHKDRAEKRRKWTDLWVFNASQPAVRRGAFSLCATVLMTLQKTQFIRSLTCEVSQEDSANKSGEAELSLQVAASPVALYQDFAPVQGVEVVLQQACFEVSTQLQQIVLTQLHRPITPQGSLEPAQKTFHLTIHLGGAEPLVPLQPPSSPLPLAFQDDKHKQIS